MVRRFSFLDETPTVCSNPTMSRLYLVLVLVVLICPALAQLPTPKTLRASCVEILVNGQLGGTGWFATTNGTVLTAAHTIGKKTDTNRVFEIRQTDGSRHRVGVDAIDFGHDICRLVPDKPIRSMPLPFAKRLPKPGQVVHLFGAPMFRHELLITGHMARTRPAYEYSDGHYCRCVFVSGIGPQGTSGGPWFNRKGEVFGLQSAMVTNQGAPQGLCMVAPLDALQALLRAEGHAHSASLEAALEETFEQGPDFQQANTYKPPALVLRHLVKDGAAEHAGLKDRELLVAMDGTAYETRDAFFTALRKLKPGTPVALTIRDARGENPREVKLTLSRLEAHWAAK